MAQPARMEDLLLFRLSRLLGVGGSPVIRLCEGGYGITRREWRVLALLAQHDALGSSELAEQAQLDRARTSRALGSLVAKGLALRAVRANDRRRVTITLTAAGRALYGELFPQVKRINASLLSVLEPAQVTELDRLMDILQIRADAMARDPQLKASLPKADRRKGTRLRRGEGSGG